MFKRVLKNIASKKNIMMIIYVLIINGVLLSGAWIKIKPLLENKPCAVCGRADTKPKESLLEYKQGPVPLVKDIDIYYCQNHFRGASKFIKEAPGENDTVLNRYYIVLGISSLLFFVLIYTIGIINIHFGFMFIQPLILTILFLIFGFVSNITCTSVFTMLFAVPLFLFWLWNKYLLGKS